VRSVILWDEFDLSPSFGGFHRKADKHILSLQFKGNLF